MVYTGEDFISYLLNHSLYGLATDLTRPIIEMTGAVRSDKGKITESNKKWDLLEIDKLYETFKSYLKKSEEAEMAKRSAIIDRKVASIAYKVRHDIKASLYIAENKLSKIPPELSHISSAFKSIFHRICNIAEDIPQFKEPSLIEEDDVHELKNFHTASIVSEIINEFSTSSLIGKKIIFNLEYKGKSFYSFCRVDITKFKRTLVNLIKNSLDAIFLDGTIDILLSNDEDFLYMSIKDMGIGMTKAQLEKVGQPGTTFKGKGGTGLGVSSAIENIKKWKGTLKIESIYGAGSTIKITLPLSEENMLLPTQIFIEPNTEVIVADDDPLCLDLYREKFSKRKFKEKGIRFTFIDNTNDLKKALAQSKKTGWNYFLLSDQNFYKEKDTGMDIIKELNVLEKSILITSDATNTALIKKSEQARLPMISTSIIRNLDIIVAV